MKVFGDKQSATDPLTLATLRPRLVEAIGAVDGAHLDPRTFRELTTLRIGGAPAAVVVCRHSTALAEVVKILDAASQALIVLGGGSNLVVGDGPEVADRVVVLAEADPAVDPEQSKAIAIDAESGVARAYAGVNWDVFVAATVRAGLGGLECLSGIPGSVGATPVQNVGAYGAEIADTLKSVYLYDRRTTRSSWVTPDALGLSYRYSNLKFTQRAVVTRVEFQLDTEGLSIPLRFGELARHLGISAEEAAQGSRAARRPVAEVREAVLELRRRKGMVLEEGDYDTWSAGSFFTNPIVQGTAARAAVRAAVAERVGEAEAERMPVFSVGSEEQPAFKFSAAWLIERAGFTRGWHLPEAPQAALSSKHTLALTNRGGASSADVVALARAVRAGVFEAFGVELEPEPVWLGAQI
ncbi:UDP-N-acetylenolpyruvoylglucosamine reductase [Corynebacterium heidelbergense]|nr:UDP-N-acetylenolpyruvoylglucosamine reductase [Corynebacterium heidelbergense]